MKPPHRRAHYAFYPLKSDTGVEVPSVQEGSSTGSSLNRGPSLVQRNGLAQCAPRHALLTGPLAKHILDERLASLVR